MTVELLVGGQRYEGWKSATITRSVRAISGAFRLSVTDNWSGSGSIFFIRPGDECQVKIGGEPVITGYAEQIDNTLSAGGHTTAVAGRDKTGDLVDCSAICGQGELLNVDLLQIAQRLTEPFGLSVRAEVDVGAAFANFSIQPGETVFDALERAAKLRGLLFSTDGLGNVVITKLAAGRASSSLIEGQNIKRASLKLNTTGRYSEYIARGQITATDENYGAQAAQAEGRVADATVNRYRPLLILAEDQANTADARKRAEWEAAVRAANSMVVSVTVQGFEQQEGGSLWKCNELISVESPTLGVKGQLLITDVNMALSGGSGSETTLTLQRSDAFVPKPQVKKSSEPIAESDW